MQDVLTQKFANPSRLLIFIATYNESGNIISLLDKIWLELPHANILVIDDNSPDGTGEILNKISKNDPRLEVIHRPRKLGLGTAHHLAMIYAINHKFDTLVTMDADHSHNPSDIPRLLQHLSAADFVIGSRYMKGGACDYKGYRRILSRGANIAARLLLGIPLHEFTTSFRAFKVSALENVNFVKMHNKGYSFFMESVYRLQQAGLKLTEVPINFGDRNSGESKIPRLEIFRGMIKLLHLVVSRLLRRQTAPLTEKMRDNCSYCQSQFISVYYPKKINNVVDSGKSDAFRCSSMAHTNKPCVVKCLQCGLIQVPKNEHPHTLEDIYANVVDEAYLANLPAKKKTFSKAYKSIQSYLPSTGKLLEVGSYCGLFLNEAKKNGWDVTGIEPSKWAANHAASTHPTLKIINGSLENVSIKLDNQYDVVVTWDVLEHVRDPVNYLKIINQSLKEQGTIALSTLDISSWFPRLVGRQWPWVMEMHLYYFDPQVLKDIFKTAGFELLEAKSYCHYASLRYIYKKICSIFPGWMSRLLLSVNKLIPEWVIPVTLGDVKLFVGKKVKSVIL